MLSTITNVSGHLEDIFRHKKHSISKSKLSVYLNLSVYISRDFSSLFAIEMYGWPYFSGSSLHREYYRTLYSLI